jgi:hypothetical protein
VGVAAPSMFPKSTSTTPPAGLRVRSTGTSPVHAASVLVLATTTT